MADNYDVVILGTGNAGMGAAGVTRATGRSVAMIESRDVGGTCPIRGCVPKKVLVAAAQVLHQIDLAPQHHISVGEAKLDWPALVARERTHLRRRRARRLSQKPGKQGDRTDRRAGEVCRRKRDRR
jgi:glutathione reductase (NADPH)